MVFRPDRDLLFDEATEKYGGRMTRLKHVQTRYKPYDGIWDKLAYSLNSSTSGYNQNLRVDLRDGTAIGTMFEFCLAPFEGCGYNVWGDNWGDNVCLRRHAQVYPRTMYQLRGDVSHDLWIPVKSGRRGPRPRVPKYG